MLREACISPQPRSWGDDERWRKTDGSWGGSALGETGFRSLTHPRELERPANTEFDSVLGHCHSREGTETLRSNAVRVWCHTAGNAPVADYMNTRGSEHDMDAMALSRTTAQSAPQLPFEPHAILATAATNLSSRDAEFLAVLSGFAPSSQLSGCVQDQIPDPPSTLGAAPVSDQTTKPLQPQQPAHPDCVNTSNEVPHVASMVAHLATSHQQNTHHLAGGTCSQLPGTPRTIPSPNHPEPVVEILGSSSMPPDTSVPGRLNHASADFFPAPEYALGTFFLLCTVPRPRDVLCRLS